MCGFTMYLASRLLFDIAYKTSTAVYQLITYVLIFVKKEMHIYRYVTIPCVFESKPAVAMIVVVVSLIGSIRCDGFYPCMYKGE